MNLREILRFWRSHFDPRLIVLGAILGFGGMCVLGRIVARIDYHPGFIRFTPWDAPDTKYYPTVNEMMAIVRHECRPDQILVIVGGNSVLLGVGQPPDHLWSRYLQEDLGSKYCVINLAFRGAPPTNGGGVVAEALRKEFPRQIYIANLPPTQVGYPDGSPVYRYTNYDAYYKGLLIKDDPARNAGIKASNADKQYVNMEFALPELKLREWLDSLFYFQDMWNYFTFTKMNTVWGFYLPGALAFRDPLRWLDPRENYTDPEPDFLQMPLSSRYLPSTVDGEMANVRGVSIYAYNKGPNNQWVIYQPVWDLFQQEAAGLFPQPLKKRTLILMGYNSPFYLSRLSPEERVRNDLTFNHAVEVWEQAGYSALAYGQNYTLDDAGDRTHLTWRGGQKLARTVADKVREMSAQLGYLKP
jgi:hypothetical protein